MIWMLFYYFFGKEGEVGGLDWIRVGGELGGGFNV